MTTKTKMHRLLLIEVYVDYVIICGQIVRRPSSISPSQWLDLWEHN
jgi:hypothetical protein